MRKILVCAAGWLGVLVAASAARANLIQDGGFEAAAPNAPPSSTRDYAAVQSFDGGSWFVTQGTAGIDTTNRYVYAGNKSLFLTDGPGLDAVTQTVATTPGQKYQLSFYANADTANSVSVLWGGVPIVGAPTSINQGGFPGTWTQYTADVTATAASTVLTIEGITHFTSGQNNTTVEIDNVRLNAVNSVPEPLSLGLLAVGAGLVVAVRRRGASA